MADEKKRPRREGSEEGAGQTGEQPPGEGMQPHVLWAVVSAIVLALFAPALFVAGFFTNELVDDDGGETAVVAQPTPAATAVPATPTPAPVVAPTVDDDPFTGPEDAAVTLIEFSDYE